jgi:hypothetical protein
MPGVIHMPGRQLPKMLRQMQEFMTDQLPSLSTQSNPSADDGESTAALCSCLRALGIWKRVLYLCRRRRRE